MMTNDCCVDMYLIITHMITLVYHQLLLFFLPMSMTATAAKGKGAFFEILFNRNHSTKFLAVKLVVVQDGRNQFSYVRLPVMYVTADLVSCYCYKCRLIRMHM